MTVMVPALTELTQYEQFILYRIEGSDKLPVGPSGRTIDPHDPSNWMSYERASEVAVAPLGVGFVFSVSDPFFFVDLDKCLEGDRWSTNATNMLGHFAGAAVEVSQSGTGLHIIGQYSGAEPAHSCKNKALGMELYTSRRFVALTQRQAVGDCSRVCDTGLAAIIPACFPPRALADRVDWRDTPVAEWNGIEDDDELITKALASASAAGVFGGGASFRDLWECNVDVLATAYPEQRDNGYGYDPSLADMSLAQRLAFWTGNNHERIQSLMRRSGLVRDKYEREDYMQSTIEMAVNRQTQVYGERAAVAEGLPELACKSDAQRLYAEQIRAGRLAVCESDELRATLSEDRTPLNTAKFWLDNQDDTPDRLAERAEPISGAGPKVVLSPQAVVGVQFLSADMQIEHFQGCVYVQNLHRVLTPAGDLLKTDQFKTAYGGYTFQMDDGTVGKTTKNAWEAFTESQCVRFPKVYGTTFRPDRPAHEITLEDGQYNVNTYVELDIPRTKGDIEPFLIHLRKILPVKRDRDIVLAYMAACVQHKGFKFQWAPLIQGAEGNGKTLLTRCIAAAVGKRYTHFPKARDIDSKFNGWLMNNLFIGVEDIHTGNKLEIIEALKPMITGDGLEIELKGVDQITAEICCNFIFNSNYKDGIKKTEKDRRFAVFYSAQQTAEDITRAGMGGDYFPKLYKWLNDGGYAIVAEYLYTYPIPDELNPAKLCHRAPETSSTTEAVEYSRGNVDQMVLEAIGEERVGFCGGWVSSIMLDKLLKENRVKLAPNKRRDMMKGIGYDWHPSLDQGRVNNYIVIDGGKPKLFIRNGHMATEEPAREVARLYEEAQQKAAGAVFQQGVAS